MEESPFQRFAASMMDEVLSWNPSSATQLGWHKYDDKLPDWSLQSIHRQVERMSELSDKLERFEEASLSGDESIDRDLGLFFLRLGIFELSELRMFEKVSTAAAEIGDSLFFLYVKDRLKAEERLDSITSRLEAVPSFLESARSIVKTPYRMWNEIQHETGERIPGFLEEIEDFAESKLRDSNSRKRLKKAVKEALVEIKEHNSWLKNEVIPNAIDRFCIGPELYRRYLDLKGYGTTPEETLRIAELHMESVVRDKAAISTRIVTSANPDDALRKMRSDHPASFTEVLNEYRSSVVRAKEFIQTNGLATIPEDELLQVIETPVFMRHLTAYAAQYEPGKFDDDRKGIFLVTPDEGDLSLLEEHNRAAIANTSVHEGYPGHHLHGICANLFPSYVRPVCQSPDFAEGWALYCEDMMISHGYNDNPMGRLMTLNDLSLRIARQICDVKLSSGIMTVNQAASFIAGHTGANIKAATSEAKSIMLDPTYFSSYFIGKLGVMQLKEELQRAMGTRFDLRFFHDSMIYSGCMPMSFMRKAVALRLRDEYDIVLGPPKETVYEYALRILGR